MKHKFSLSCVIVTKNRPESLLRLLRSMALQSLRTHQVVVVNDGGACLSAEALKREIAGTNEESQLGPQLILIENARSVGSGEARNAGVKASAGEIILLLDDDVELLSPDFLERGLAGFQENIVGIVFPKKLDVSRGETLELSLFIERELTGELVRSNFENESEKVGNSVIYGPMVAFVRRKAFLDVDGYDSVYGLGIGHSFREESDFQKRVQSEGWAVKLVPEISFKHHIQPSGGHGPNQFKKVFWIAHNQAVFGFRHLKKWPMKQIFFLGIELPRYAWGNGRFLTYPAGLLGSGAGLVTAFFKQGQRK